MATVTVPGTTQTSNDVIASGLHRNGRVVRGLTLSATADPDRVLASAVDAARHSGWKNLHTEQGPDAVWFGTKKARGHRLNLGISLLPATPTVLQLIIFDNLSPENLTS